MRISSGHIEVLECRSCGFLGTVDLFSIENNQAWCPACGNIYLAYSQVPVQWYIEQQRRTKMEAKGLEEIGPGMWVRKTEETRDGLHFGS